jgi:hypothetical protein
VNRGRSRDGDGERHSWHGFREAKPKLPSYFRPLKRLRGLDEFEEPEWKGRMRWPEDDRVTLRGVARETMLWLIGFVIAGVIAVNAWHWLYGDQTCVEIMRGFKIGWC